MTTSHIILPRGRGKKRVNNHYRIEGENVTSAQIAARLGFTEAMVCKRMRALRDQAGAITWDKLKGKKR